MNSRTWAVRWMYAAIGLQLLVGILLPWIGGASIFEDYHRGIETAFWGQAAAPAAPRAQQVWWIGFFGPTVQAASIWMAALTHIGHRTRSPAAWVWLIAGLLVWAPQDILISLRADCWAHVWIDCLALAALLPPLCWLWLHDRAQAIST